MRLRCHRRIGCVARVRWRRAATPATSALCSRPTPAPQADRRPAARLLRTGPANHAQRPPAPSREPRRPAGPAPAKSAIRSGRRAIIAGGAGGIGTAICRRLGEEGVHVVCADISERRGRAVAEELSGQGLTVSFEHLDAGDPESWDRLASGQPCVDTLVTAAYLARGGQIQLLSNEDWKENFRVTLDGVFYGMRACLKRMERGAAIVNISSVAALLGISNVRTTRHSS